MAHFGVGANRRAFRPACGAHGETAAHLVEHVIPHAPVHQWVNAQQNSATSKDRFKLWPALSPGGEAADEWSAYPAAHRRDVMRRPAAVRDAQSVPRAQGPVIASVIPGV